MGMLTSPNVIEPCQMGRAINFSLTWGITLTNDFTYIHARIFEICPWVFATFGQMSGRVL